MAPTPHQVGGRTHSTCAPNNRGGPPPFTREDETVSAGAEKTLELPLPAHRPCRSIHPQRVLRWTCRRVSSIRPIALCVRYQFAVSACDDKTCLVESRIGSIIYKAATVSRTCSGGGQGTCRPDSIRKPLPPYKDPSPGSTALPHRYLLDLTCVFHGRAEESRIR